MQVRTIGAEGSNDTSYGSMEEPSIPLGGIRHRRYKVYPSRWGVLVAVALLTVANNTLWISYAAINTIAADYYHKDPGQIDMLTTVSFVIGIPLCLLSTWIVNKLGLRFAVYSATVLTFLGGLLRCISTLPGLNEKISLDVQFWLAIAAQAITGMGNPIAVSLPTKVSQHWFPEHETTMATSVLALSLPVGIVMGYGVTTAFVKEANDVPTMNWAWFIPAAVAMFACVIGMRRSMPPTPPSRSAEFDQQAVPYLKSMKTLLTTLPYLVIMFTIGGAVGFFNAFLTLMQKMMCSRGYETWVSGLCGSLLLGTGFIGAMTVGWIVERTGRMVEAAKVTMALAVITGIAICEFMRKSDQEVVLIILCALFGVVGFGLYPLGLELSVEASYPADEAAATALIFLSGQVQGAILVGLSNAMAQDLSEEASKKELCTELGNGDDFFKGQDHTNFLMLLMGFICLLGVVFIAGFHTEYNRHKANEEAKNNIEKTPSTEGLNAEQIL